MTCVESAILGPYRFVRHPIYWGVTISAFGLMLLSGADMRGLIVLVGTVAYALFQGGGGVLPLRHSQQFSAGASDSSYSAASA